MSSARNQGWVPQSTGDTQHNVRDAALRGASLAFSKPRPKPKPVVKNYTGGDNGALLAATRVGTRSPASVRRNYTGGSVGGTRPNLSKSDSSSSLGVPDDHGDRISSPSNIAARLAAARHSPLRPTRQAAVTSVMGEQQTDDRDALPPSGSVGNVLARLEHKKPAQQPQKRRDSLGSHSAAANAQRPKPHHETTDDTPIPPTNSLVKMFEQAQRPTTPTSTPAAPLHVTRDSPPPVRSPKPQRAFRMPPEPKEDAAPLHRTRTHTPPPVKPKPNIAVQLSSPNIDSVREQAYFNTPQKDPVKSPRISQKPAQLTPIKTAISAPPKPPSRKASSQAQLTSAQKRRVSTSGEGLMSPSSPSSFNSQQTPAIRTDPDETTYAEPEPDSNATPKYLSASPANINCRKRIVVGISQQLSTRIGQADHTTHDRRVTFECDNGCSPGISLAQRFSSITSNKQSPPKNTGKMRTTMRKEPSSSDDEDSKVDKYKKKGTRIMGIKGRKHPNKHHEGTRRRWRDQITERERKRYEGVWAANKGLYLPPSASTLPDDDPSADVLNLCVQEIWTRSRLPTHVLEEVWDLVDSRGVGRLSRYEFVVGLWLIDQRLKGRKLPIKVSDSVWESARGVGIKVKIRD
ncbi:EH domain containing protein [Pyrenophora tritici-repentis]|nr:EH domain containing protein [Pyrenophora tritici-repentis]